MSTLLPNFVALDPKAVEAILSLNEPSEPYPLNPDKSETSEVSLDPGGDGENNMSEHEEKDTNINTLSMPNKPEPAEDHKGDVASSSWNKSLTGKEEDLSKPAAVEKCCHCWYQTRGIICCLISVVFQTLQNQFNFMLLRNYDYGPFNLLATRFIMVSMLCTIFLPIHKLALHEDIWLNIWPLTSRSNLWNIFKIIFRSILGVSVMAFHLYAFEYITPGEVSTIVRCNPLFVAVIARIFLKEPLTIFHFCVAILTLIGVILITRTPYIIRDSNYSEYHLVGIALAFGAMASVSGVTLIVRVLRTVHYVQINFGLGLVGMLIASIVAAVTHEFFMPRSKEEFLFLAAIGIFTYVSLTFQSLSLRYESAGPIAVTRSLEVVFSYLFQMMSNQYPDGMTITGAFLVVSSVFLIGFQRYLMERPPEHLLRRKLWFILK